MSRHLKEKIINDIIKCDNNHQAHPIRKILERAAKIEKNKTVTLKLSETGEDCNFASGYIFLKAGQVIPEYVPKSIFVSIVLDTDVPLEYNYNLKSILSKFNQ